MFKRFRGIFAFRMMLRLVDISYFFLFISGNNWMPFILFIRLDLRKTKTKA